MSRLQPRRKGGRRRRFVPSRIACFYFRKRFPTLIWLACQCSLPPQVRSVLRCQQPDRRDPDKSSLFSRRLGALATPVPPSVADPRDDVDPHVLFYRWSLTALLGESGLDALWPRDTLRSYDAKRCCSAIHQRFYCKLLHVHILLDMYQICMSLYLFRSDFACLYNGMFDLDIKYI